MPPTVSDKPLVVASYNLHSCIGGDGRLDPGRVAAVIRELGADVVALQEVDAQQRVGGYLDQWSFLAAAVGVTCIPGISLRTHRKNFGNALMTRCPIEAVRLHDISVPGREPRGVIDADLRVRGGRLRVLATHLGLSTAERRAQAARLDHLLDGEDAPVLLLGDLNEWRPGAGSLSPVAGRFAPGRMPASFPARLPLLSLDRIYAAPGLRMTGPTAHGSALARLASDHLPVRANLPQVS